MALKKGIRDPKPRVTNIKGANLKSLIYGNLRRYLGCQQLRGIILQVPIIRDYSIAVHSGAPSHGNCHVSLSKQFKALRSFLGPVPPWSLR